MVFMATHSYVFNLMLYCIPEGVWFNDLRLGLPGTSKLVLTTSAGRSLICCTMFVYKGKASLVEAYYGTIGFQEAESPRFLDNRRI